MITLKNVTKVYGTKTKVNALRGIDLNIKAGEIFGIIGKSGAGKSTLVRCLKDRQAAILLLMTVI